MLNVDQYIKSPEETYLLIKNQKPCKIDKTTVAYIFESFKRLLVILTKDAFEDLYPNDKDQIKYIVDCYHINYYSISFLLKHSRYEFEQEMIDKQNMISHSKNKEIESIKSFLYDESIHESIKDISKILNRSIVHYISLIPDDNEDFNVGLGLSMDIDASKELDYSSIRNDIYKVFIDNDIALDIYDTKKYLKYYNTATPINEKEYLAFYKPIFEALHEYLNYLENKKVEDETNEEVFSNGFIVKDGDFRTEEHSSVSFDDIKEKDRLKYIEELLFEDKIIDSNYNFIEKKGNKITLAKLVKFMINEKYFRPNNFKHRTNFKDYHYRQYFDNRYNVDTSQQFKRIIDNEVKQFIESKQWKYNLKKLINIDYFSINSW